MRVYLSVVHFDMCLCGVCGARMCVVYVYMYVYVVYADLHLCGVCRCPCVYVWYMHVGVVYVGTYVYVVYV